MTNSTLNAAAFDDLQNLLQQLADYLEVTENLARVGAEREPSHSPSHALFAAIVGRLDFDDSGLITRAMQAVRELRDAISGVAA